MYKRQFFIYIVVFIFLLAGCSEPTGSTDGEQPEEVAQTSTATPSPPTETPAPTATSLVSAGSSNDSGEIIEIDSDRIIRISVASANLRSGPGLTFDTIDIVLFNDAFRVIAEDELALWYKIELTDGQQGWVTASVTEEVSPEVYETLVGTDEETENPVEDAVVEVTKEPEADEDIVEAAPVEPPFAIQVDTTRTGVYEEPTLTSKSLAFIARGEVYLIREFSNDGNWASVELDNGIEGWVRLGRTVGLDRETVEDAVADLEEGQTGAVTIISAEPDATSSTSNSAGQAVAVAPSTGTSRSTTSSTVAGTFGRTRLRSGSPLYYDNDNSGYGIRIVQAPSGPSGLIGSGYVPTKPDVSSGWDESEVYSQPDPRIMLLGDEFTSGTTPIANGYRRYLYNLLSSAGFVFDYVGTRNTYTNPTDFDSDHEGHVYYRADQLLAGAWGWTSYDPPDYVMLMIGMNDVLQGQSAESTGRDIQLLINTLRYLNPNVKIVLSHLPYTTDSVINKEIDLVNLQINRLSYVNNTGNSPIYIISQWDIDPATDTYDGIHLNSVGASKMANHFYYGLTQFWLVQAKENGQ